MSVTLRVTAKKVQDVGVVVAVTAGCATRVIRVVRVKFMIQISVEGFKSS